MRLAIALCLLALCPPASAQVRYGGGLDVGAGFRLAAEGSRTGDTRMLAVGIPLTVRSRLLYAAARPEIGYGPPSDSRYQFEDAGGQRICRDQRNGQFAETSDCIGVYAGLSAEGGVALQRIRLGAGYRIGFAPQPFGSLTFTPSRGLFFRAEGGPRGGVASVGIGIL